MGKAVRRGPWPPAVQLEAWVPCDQTLCWGTMGRKGVPGSSQGLGPERLPPLVISYQAGTGRPLRLLRAVASSNCPLQPWPPGSGPPAPSPGERARPTGPHSSVARGPGPRAHVGRDEALANAFDRRLTEESGNWDGAPAPGGQGGCRGWGMRVCPRPCPHPPPSEALHSPPWTAAPALTPHRPARTPTGEQPGEPPRPLLLL